jgi:hypothetical protein
LLMFGALPWRMLATSMLVVFNRATIWRIDLEVAGSILADSSTWCKAIVKLKSLNHAGRVPSACASVVADDDTCVASIEADDVTGIDTVAADDVTRGVVLEPVCPMVGIVDDEADDDVVVVEAAPVAVAEVVLISMAVAVMVVSGQTSGSSSEPSPQSSLLLHTLPNSMHFLLAQAKLEHTNRRLVVVMIDVAVATF